MSYINIEEDEIMVGKQCFDRMIFNEVLIVNEKVERINVYESEEICVV